MRKWVAGPALLVAWLPAVMGVCQSGRPARPRAAASGQPAAVARPPADARRETIRRTIRGIEQECERHGGDWDRWFAELAPFRLALRKRVAALKPYNPMAEGTVEARDALLEAVGEPPLFETAPHMYLRHIYEPEDLNGFVASRSVVPALKSVAAWLKARHIDLIFVPVPKMTEVYADRFLPETPADMIVAPQNRKLLLELLKADVEVVDLLPLFLEARRSKPKPLYRPVDPHWAQRGIQIAAREIAQRLTRYDFVRRAMAEPPGYKTSEGEEYHPGAGFPALNPEQKRRVEKALTSRVVWIAAGSKPVFSNDGAVLFIGDSYSWGLMEAVARGANMPVHNAVTAGQTTAAIRDFVRDPTLLDKCRVLIWVNNFTVVASAEWKIPPLP